MTRRVPRDEARTEIVGRVHSRDIGLVGQVVDEQPNAKTLVGAVPDESGIDQREGFLRVERAVELAEIIFAAIADVSADREAAVIARCGTVGDAQVA